MMISTKGRYLLRVMLDLAERQADRLVPMKEIAEHQGLSLKYLERIMPVLTKHGLVEGTHGKGGGYRLTRTPEQYSVGEILRLAEGEHIASMCCWGVGIIAILVTGIVLNRPLLIVAAMWLLLIGHAWRNHTMMAYVERKVFDSIPRNGC